MVQASDVLPFTRGHPMHAYIVVTLTTGLRTEEVRALSWDHLELDGDPDAGPRVPPSVAVWRPIAKDTGLANLPLQSYDSNRIGCAIVMLAGDLLAWMQTLALHDHPARRWEPKRLRHRLLTIPATLARTGRRVQLHLKDAAPFADLTCTGWTRLAALAPP